MDQPRSPEPADEFDDVEPADPAPAPEPAKRYANVSPTRRGLWVVGGLAGTYMIVRGLYGVITGEDQQP